MGSSEDRWRGRVPGPRRSGGRRLGRARGRGVPNDRVGLRRAACGGHQDCAEDETEGDSAPALSDEAESDEPVEFEDDVLLDDEDEDPIEEIGDVAKSDDSET